MFPGKRDDRREESFAEAPKSFHRKSCLIISIGFSLGWDGGRGTEGLGKAGGAEGDHVEIFMVSAQLITSYPVYPKSTVLSEASPRKPLQSCFPADS